MQNGVENKWQFRDFLNLDIFGSLLRRKQKIWIMIAYVQVRDIMKPLIPSALG